MIKDYPKHIYEPIRYEVAENYLIHELRKLFEVTGSKYPEELERDIRNLKVSKELANPRDFWNGFHGISMGFKLKIGMLYAITAENVSWEKRKVGFEEISFGVELPQTLEVAKGKLRAQLVKNFYLDVKNLSLRKKYLEISGNYYDNSERGKDPIIAFERQVGNEKVLMVNDGNGRLGREILNQIDGIECYVGKFNDESEMFKNSWIPTSLLMDSLFFAKIVFDEGNLDLFKKYIDVVSNMVEGSESGRFELLKRSLPSQQPFRDSVLSELAVHGVK